MTIDESRLTIAAKLLIENWPESVNELAAKLANMHDDAVLFGPNNMHHATLSFDAELTPEALSVIFGGIPTIRTVDEIGVTDPVTGEDVMFRKVRRETP